jgi:hypothetical protein
LNGLEGSLRVQTPAVLKVIPRDSPIKTFNTLEQIFKHFRYSDISPEN